MYNEAFYVLSPDLKSYFKQVLYKTPFAPNKIVLKHPAVWHKTQISDKYTIGKAVSNFTIFYQQQAPLPWVSIQAVIFREMFF